jgi:cyanophycinase
MIQLASQIHGTEIPKSTKTAILVIGGAEDKVHGREILHTFFCRSGELNAKIGIIPSASREPAVIGDRYQTIFSDMGACQVQVFDIREREQGSDADLQEKMEECTGIFLTGGDQLRLWGILAETPLMERLHKRVWQGELTLAGTSAGAAVMGHHMIAGGGSGESPNRSLVDMATGLGLIPEAIVDQHFHNRNRMSRLLSAIAAYPDKIGIGIDEDTCALFERDGIIHVIGKGTVTVVDACKLSRTNHSRVASTEPISLHNVALHVLCHGDRYDMKERSVIY